METHEASSSLTPHARGTPRPVHSSGVVLRAVLQEGLAQPQAAIKVGGVPLPGEIDWPAVCAVAHRARIAPIVYQCLRSASLPVPGDVMDWFRVQHYDTVARNLASLNVLRTVLEMLAGAGIPAMAFKGPALAQLGYEMARSWKDLDILVGPGAIDRVESVLFAAGYRLMPDPPHPNHRRYAVRGDARDTALEIHFDISDPLLAYRPDVPAIWSRSGAAKILGLTARVPDLTDHLLLTVMQLPHHRWSLRLVLDIWQVIRRWQEAVDWPAFFERARAWRMLALTRSALCMLTTSLGASLPESVASAVRPVGYYDRLRLEIATQSISEQFEHPFRPRVMWLAPFVVTERPADVLRILTRRLLAGGEAMGDGRIETAVRRNLKSIEVLPEVIRVIAASVLPPPQGHGDVGSRKGSTR